MLSPDSSHDKFYQEICTTSDDQEILRRIATRLVESKLAACVQISGPIESTYRWEGKVETRTEWRLSAKSISYLTQNIAMTIREMHNDTEPEVIARRIEPVTDGYAVWLRENIAE